MSDCWEDDDYDPYEPADECDHEHAEVDILEGRMWCHCGYTKWLTGDEIKREAQLQAEQMQAYADEMHRTELDAKAAT